MGPGGAARLYFDGQSRAPLAQPQRLFVPPACGVEVRYACVSQAGFRASEPALGSQASLVVAEQAGSEDTLVVGVFDGHGKYGAQCAALVKRRLLPALEAATSAAPQDVGAQLTHAFSTLSAELHASEELDDSLSGVEAACVLLRGRELIVANVGEVRVLLGRSAPAGDDGDDGASAVVQETLVLSTSHTPWRAEERARVRAAGAEVASCDQKEGLARVTDGGWNACGSSSGLGPSPGDVDPPRPPDVDPPRVWVPGADHPGCAFTRSLGDALGEKVGVTAEPDLASITLRPGNNVLLIGSAGLFEYLDGNSALRILADAAGPAEGARAVVAEAGERWLQNEGRVADLTAFVVFFEWLSDADAAAEPAAPPLVAFTLPAASRGSCPQLHTLGDALTAEQDADERSGWNEIRGERFGVRSASYLSDKKKAMSDGSLFATAAVDIFTSARCEEDVATRPGMPAFEHLARSTDVELFILNIQLPGPPNIGLVQVFSKPIVSADAAAAMAGPHGVAERLWQRFRDGSDEFRSSKLKLIANPIKAPLAIRMAMPVDKPVVIGTRIPLRWHKHERSLEVVLDVAFSSVAGPVWRVMKGVTRKIVLDLVLLIEASAQHELPERVLACMQYHKPALTSAVPCPPALPDSATAPPSSQAGGRKNRRSLNGAAAALGSVARAERPSMRDSVIGMGQRLRRLTQSSPPRRVSRASRPSLTAMTEQETFTPATDQEQAARAQAPPSALSHPALPQRVPQLQTPPPPPAPAAESASTPARALRSVSWKKRGGLFSRSKERLLGRSGRKGSTGGTGGTGDNGVNGDNGGAAQTGGHVLFLSPTFPELLAQTSATETSTTDGEPNGAANGAYARGGRRPGATERVAIVRLPPAKPQPKAPWQPRPQPLRHTPPPAEPKPQMRRELQPLIPNDVPPRAEVRVPALRLQESGAALGTGHAMPAGAFNGGAAEGVAAAATAAGGSDGLAAVGGGGKELEWYETGSNLSTTALLSSSKWQSASVQSYGGLLERLRMIKENGMPPMRVIAAERLEGLMCLPRSDEGHAEDALAAVEACGPDDDNRPKAVLVMFSHRWLRPLWPDPHRQAHPDSASGVKARTLVQWAKWFKWWRIFGDGREFVKGVSTDPDLKIYFWVDFCCVDQDNPGAEMAALPAYVSACAEVVIFHTADYDMRAWCQVELMMAYAFMAVGDKVFQISPGFEHRRQRTVEFKRTSLPDPLSGNLTCEADRAVIAQLRQCAVSSRTFSWQRACAGLFNVGPATAAMWTACCCGWLGGAAWLNSRAIEPGKSVTYRLTPVSSAREKAEQLSVAIELMEDEELINLRNAIAALPPPAPPPRRSLSPQASVLAMQGGNSMLMV